MKSFPPAAAMLVSILLQGCAEYHPGPPTPPEQPPGAPGWPGRGEAGFDGILESPGGSRLRYQDNHGRYTITLFPGGRYRFVSISQNETMADTTEGRWSWERTGFNRGELTIGGDTWNLRFVSPQRAEATTDGDVRPYFFSFERL
ncbi:MAG TPA: hypothetical protein VG796_23490 [Verrucomicrobiales bacterium]|nr:hypothetical protein [Verrucomicrobiales bacterium]